MVGPEINLTDRQSFAGPAVGSPGERGPRGFTGPPGDPGEVFDGLAEGEVPTADGDGGFVARQGVYADGGGALRYAATGALVPVVSGDAAFLVGNPDLLLYGPETWTRDANGAVLTAPARWPDGATGQFTALTVSSSFPGAVDSYKVTHVLNGTTRTYTQPTLTRDANGGVTVRPAITVA
jgi:hypothetical protein